MWWHSTWHDKSSLCKEWIVKAIVALAIMAIFMARVFFTLFTEFSWQGSDILQYVHSAGTQTAANIIAVSHEVYITP